MLTKEEFQKRVKGAKTKKVLISDLRFVKNYYSRKDGIDNLTVQDYSERVQSSPPILINQDNIIINGVHRYKAFLKVNQNEINVKQIQLDEAEIKIWGLFIDQDYGLRHPTKDFKSLCVNYYSANPEKNKEIYELLKISRDQFYDWTQEIRDKMTKEVNEQMSLALLNPYKTQEMIATDFGYKSNEKVSTLGKELKEKMENILDITVEELQEDNFDFLIPYKEFIEEDNEEKKLLKTSIWNLSKGDEKDFFGHFPERFMRTFIYRFTKPLDIIYDPFAGSGTTIDACKFMYRKFIVSDLTPDKSKEEIIKHDIKDELPNNLPRPNLVFLDPPYWRQAKGKYSDNKNDLGNMSLEDFYSAIGGFLKKIIAKKPDRIAILIQNTQYANENHEVEPHNYKLYNEVTKYKYEFEYEYILPYSTQQYLPQQVIVMKEKNRDLQVHRHLLIYRRNKEK